MVDINIIIELKRSAKPAILKKSYSPTDLKHDQSFCQPVDK